MGLHPIIQTYPRHKSPFRQDAMEKIQRWKVNKDKCFTLGAHLPIKTLIRLQDILRRYQHVFAWSYADLKGVQPNVCQHYIDIEPGVRHVCKRQ